MIAGTYNMLCEQGATFGRTFTIQYPNPEDPEEILIYDLLNHTARMQVRRTIESSTVLVSLTTENSGIEINDAEGKITVAMSSETTAALTSSGVYDLEIINQSGEVSRVVQGTFTLSLEVTR